MNTLAERLKYAMEVLPTKKIKGVDLARAVGVKPPSVSDWLSGKSKTMEGENLLRAAKHLNVRAIWLATGAGSIQPSQSDAVISDKSIAVWSDSDAVPDGMIPIEYFDEIAASAGSGYLNAENVQPKHLWFREETIDECDVKPEFAKVILVAGDSMYPELSDGQAIAVDTSATRIFDGEIYAFLKDDELKVKYLYQWDEQGKGGFMAKSRNEDKLRFPDEYYSPTRIENDNVRIVGQYWWKSETRKIRR